jgi:Mg2+ and Co2+ transporter CorA
MISYFKRTIKDEFLKEIPTMEIGSWIKAVDPSADEIDYLVKKFKLDRKNLESGLDQNEIPRLDFVGKDVYFLTKNVPLPQTGEIETYLVVISKNFILTLSKSEPNFVRKIIENKINFITTQKLKCLIKLFSFINESFEKLTVEIVRRVQISRKVGRELEEKELNSLLEQENILNNLVSSYHYMNLLYERTARKIKFFERDKEILEDLMIEATQRVESL